MSTSRALLSTPWRFLRRRYSVDALCYAAVQTLGYAIIFAAIFTPQAWKRFSLEYLEPNMIWVMWSLLAPPHSGAAVVTDLLALCGIVGAVAVAVPVAAATNAAAPGDNLPSPQKAATLICLTAFCYFWVTVARWRFPLFNTVGRLTQIGSALALIPGYWASVTGMSRHDIAYIVCYVFCVIAVGLLVTFFLIPLPTGMFARRAAAGALAKVSLAQREAAALLGAMGTAGAALSDATAALYDLDSQATKQLRGASLLNALTAFDFAVYWRPHRHPRKAYARLLKLAVRVERLTLAVGVTLQEGRGAGGALPQLERLAAAAADAMAAASAALSADATLESALEASAAVDTATAALLDASLAATAPNGAGVPMETVELVVMAADRVRTLCEEALAPAVGGQPPATVPSPAWATPKSSPPERLPAPKPVVELALAGPGWRLAWRRVATATGLRPWHMALALQMTVVYVATALLATNAASYNALGGETQWILITIFVISDMTAGAVAVAGVDRVAGCAVGCAFSAAVVGLALAINGGPYDNAAGKLVTIGVCLSLWAGWCRAERSRASPKSDKLWSQASIVPMVCVVSQATDAPWTLLAYRMANVAVGVALQAVASALFFPVTTRAHSRTLVAAALQEAAVTTEATFEVLGAAGEGEEESQEGVGGNHDVEGAGAAAEAERAQAAAAEERGMAAAAAALDHLDQMVLLRRGAVVFWGVLKKIGPEHEELARALQVYLSHLSSCIAEKRLLARAGAWRLDAEARQSSAAAGAQLAAALRALELTVTGYASLKAATGIREAVVRISGELEAAAAPSDVPPSKLQLVAPVVISRAFARVVRQLVAVYTAADTAFQLDSHT